MEQKVRKLNEDERATLKVAITALAGLLFIPAIGAGLQIFKFIAYVLFG